MFVINIEIETKSFERQGFQRAYFNTAESIPHPRQRILIYKVQCTLCTLRINEASTQFIGGVV